MADIFRKSFLTIAATAGSDSSAGLFTTKAAPISVPGTDGQTQTVFVRRKILHVKNWAIRDHNKGDFRLFTRGWVFQERILSPRVLHFGPHELFWECNQQSLCQCGETTHKDERFSLTKSPLHAKFTNSVAEELQHSWRDLIEEYSSLYLTIPSDKMWAIAGLMSDMSLRRTGEQYVAGLWSGSLQTDLLWIAITESHLSSDGEEFCEPYMSYRREGWRAPSWSWASVDANIRWPQSKRGSKRNAESKSELFFEAAILDDGLCTFDGQSGAHCVTLQLQGETFPAMLDIAEWEYGDGIALRDHSGQALYGDVCGLGAPQKLTYNWTTEKIC
jgi:hypothetical protein